MVSEFRENQISIQTIIAFIVGPIIGIVIPVVLLTFPAIFNVEHLVDSGLAESYFMVIFSSAASFFAAPFYEKCLSKHI